MRLRMGTLRRLLREAMHDTVITPTQLPEPSPASEKGFSMQPDSPIETKTDQVIKLLNKQDYHLDTRDVKKVLSTLNPKRLLVLSAEDLAKALVKKLAN